MHAGEHFEDITSNDLRAGNWQSAEIELPQTSLCKMIADGHWQRLMKVGDRCR